MKVEGLLTHDGYDDPPMCYYGIVTTDGKHIAIGFNPKEWGVECGDGIPDLPIEGGHCELEIKLKPR